MKVRIADSEALKKITPSQILTYLKSKGAKKTDLFEGKAAIFAYKDNELLVPLASHYSDYALRMADIMSCLEKIEDRSQLEILEDIVCSGFDIIRLSFVSANEQPKKLNLKQSALFIHQAHDLMLAAACSAANHRCVYQGRHPLDADCFMQGVRLGQTDYGSFSVKVLAPVAPELKTLPDGEIKEESYERLVVPTLESGLEALNRAARRSGLDHDIAHFLDAVQDGVSSNLCEAISGMFDQIAEYLEVGISYSANRLKPRPMASIRIDAGYIPIIREAAAQMVALYRGPEDGQLVRGYVVRLASAKAEEGRAITVKDVMTKRPRHLKVILSDEDYQKAGIAYHEKNLVELSGSIIRSGRTQELVPNSPLKIIALDGDES